MLTLDRLQALSVLMEDARGVPGSTAEVGVYKGGTARYIARTLREKTCHLFDTFTGMPTASDVDRHKAGDFADVSLNYVKNTTLGDCFNARFHPGLFPATTEGIEDRFAFVHVDGDLYQTTKDALAYFWPRMNPGGIIVFDDYDWPNCPGVRMALEEFGEEVRTSTVYQAYLIKPNED